MTSWGREGDDSYCSFLFKKKKKTPFTLITQKIKEKKCLNAKKKTPNISEPKNCILTLSLIEKVSVFLLK